jgi:hemoglobin
LGVVEQAGTMYDRVGGQGWFEALADRFYRAVAADPVLRPLYPADPAGLEAAREHLCGFLIQYWGGPGDYSRARGHPRLRMRHAPFAIGVAERNAWFGHMADAVRAGDLDPGDEAEILAYFETAATHMINTA